MPVKKLQKLPGQIFGVCEGLGDYFNVDPTLLRILFVIMSLTVGGGLFLYVILALLMPEDHTETEEEEKSK